MKTHFQRRYLGIPYALFMMCFVIAPVADGSSKTPALFNAKDEWASDTPVAFELQSAEVKDGGSVWLRYLVKR